MCQTSLPSSHDKTRHRQAQQKRLRGHGGPGGVSLYWRQRRSQLRMRRGYSAVSGGTCGVAWGASRTVARPLATTGTLRGCILAFFPLTGVVLGVWWRVGEIGCRGLSFPFFLSIFLTTRMECSAALFLIARRSDEVRGRAGPRGVDCIVDAEWTTDVRWRLSGPPTGGWREPSARERKLRNAMPRLGRVWRSMPRGTAVNLQPWSVEC